jgi:Glycosyltransferase family 87
MSRASPTSRPPLWLAMAAVAAFWAATYDVATWLVQFARQPIHPDFRIFYVAAEAGVRYGWPSIYDLAKLRALSASFPAGQTYINEQLPYINPPLLAWLIAPLTALPVPIAFALWSALSLAALVWAWQIAAPFAGLRKAALLLLALALWPVLDAFYFGQPSLIVLALVAAAWCFCLRNQPLAAGAALAVATGLKPHVVILVPFALAAAGHYRIFLAWAGACVVLAAAFVVTLGADGLSSWWQVLQYGQTDTGQSRYTIAFVVGTGPISYGLELLQGAAALVVARRGRADLNVVLAAGLVGSLALAFHLHQYDYVGLVLAAWLILRTSPPLWHRLWLLLGVASMQALSVGQPVPQLMWDAGWLVILGLATSTRPLTELAVDDHLVQRAL